MVHPSENPSGILVGVGSDRRGLFIGIGLVVLLAAAVGAIPRAGRSTELAGDVVVASAPGAVVPRPDPGSLVDNPPCNVTPSTGEATVFYRVAPRQEWTKLAMTLCHPPGFSPGAVGLSFRSPEGAQLRAVIPASGWRPHQRWRGFDAQIDFRLTVDSTSWLAWDADLPCRIQTDALRRFFAPIVVFEGEPTPNGKVLIGASVRASFDCTQLPLFKVPGAAPVDVRGELSTRNCEGTARVLPPPALPAGCPDA